MILGVHYPAPPVRDFDKEEQDVRADIASNEKLVDGIWRVLPLFIHPATAVKYGLGNCEHRLLELRNALRDWMCGGAEEHLAQLQAHRANPGPAYQRPKPTPEQLVSAQLNVERMEQAVDAMNNIGEKENFAFGPAVALMRPMVEMQLDQARNYLEAIQNAMEESDEATRSPMSNEAPSVEAGNPDEAKP